MLRAITEGSLASSPTTLSAGGQDEQPCDVKSSITARGSAATAGRTTATIAQTPRALDHREIELQAIITVIPEPGNRYCHHSPLPSNGPQSHWLSIRAGHLQLRVPAPWSLLTSR